MASPNSQASAAAVQGLREAKAAFRALPEIVRARILDVRARTAFSLVRRAQANLRRSPSIRTRALHDHVDYQVTKSSGRVKAGVRTGTTTLSVNGRRLRVKGIIAAGRGGSARTLAGATRIQPTAYDHMIEFGTRHSKPEPFMIPAAEAEAPEYLARCRAAGPRIEQDMARIGVRNL